MSNHITRQFMVHLNQFPGKATRPADLKALVNAMRVTPIGQELIRIGSDRDGGYLLPDDLEGIEHCFSPGVANCSDFEKALADRGMQVFMADRSIERPPEEDPRFRFIRKYIASTNAPGEGLVTLDEWYRCEVGTCSEHRPDALLQMDIEGCEYEVLHSLSDTLLNRFRIVIVEFHKLSQLVDRFSFGWMAPALRKLLRTHAVVHIHPNNNRHILAFHGIQIPSTMEITFLRRDRIRPSNKKLSFPHPLDCKCVGSKRELVLPVCWYK